MTLITYPNPILNEVSTAVTEAELAYVKSLVPDMQKVMIQNKGVGLAAVQVGILKRFCIIRDKDNNINLIINPLVVEEDTEIQNGQEGCLSLPLFFEQIERPMQLTAEFIDGEFVSRKAVFYGIEARCLLHEIEHMNGTPIHNKVSSMKKQMWVKKLKKKGVL